MDNPTKCYEINSKIITTNSQPDQTLETGVAVSTMLVNAHPPSSIHLQHCYRDSTVPSGVYFITEPYGNQFTTQWYTTSVDAYYITTNRATLYALVQLTLVDYLNNESIVILETNGTEKVFTNLKIYKNCNDIKCIDVALAPNDIIFAIHNNESAIRVVLGARFKYNPIFMCCNATDGTPRKAKLIGIPQIYSGTPTNFCMHKYQQSGFVGAPYASTCVVYSVIYVDNTVSTAPSINNRIVTPVSGQIELLPGETAWWQRTAASNTLAVVLALWEYNLTS